jgi:hypothetical protein
MTRILCFPLVLLLALPMFAQESELGQLGQPLPRNPGLLMQMRDDITLKLQQNKDMQRHVGPNDVQFAEMLQTQEAELVRQLRDIMQQIQEGSQPPVPVAPGNGGMVQDRNMPGRNAIPSGMIPGQPPAPPMPISREPLQVPPGGQSAIPGIPPGMYPGMQPGMYTPTQSPTGITQYVPPQPPYAPFPVPMQPNWREQEPQWGGDVTPPWAPKLPQELTEVKQSVESLRKEVADLKETIKSLEGRIEMLYRAILMSDKLKESGN